MSGFALSPIEPSMNDAGDPHARMFQMIFGYAVSQIVNTAARLSLAEHLANEVLTPEELAVREDLHPETTRRWLRACSSLGLVTYMGETGYSSTPLLETLRRDAPESMWGNAIAQAGPGHYLPWGQLSDAVRTGKPQASSSLHSELWEYYAHMPDEAAALTAAMASITTQNNKEVARLLDTHGHSMVIDVGGAGGSLLCSLLAQNDQLSGIVLDLPHVVEKIDGGGHFQVQAGDFLVKIPPADLYLLRWILHDWNDEVCLTILRNCRKAIAHGGKLVIIETIVTESAPPLVQSLMDLTMLNLFGGKERSLSEFDNLLTASGFQRVAVPKVEGIIKMIEAIPI